MLKENKWKVAVSSVIILLPALFGLIMWDALPETMTAHWNAAGNGDGFGAKAFMVLGLPVILLIGHLVCLFFTSLDKKQENQNPKALRIIFWIIPVVSLFVSGIVYSTAFGKAFGFELLTPAMLGVLFICIGNYLPKIKQNRTLGIKISWTLNNEENWNKTHRFGGKVWVAGGFVMLSSIFLPGPAMMIVMGCSLAAILVIPMVYSYSIYKKHRKEGIAYAAAPKSKAEKVTVRIAGAVTAVILIATAVLMFTGDITVDCGDTAFEINANYWGDLKVDYSEIDTISYRENLDTGIRTNGFGSMRLLTGNFRNDEFGPYVLYAYTGSEGFVVLTSDEKTLVIGMKDAAETRELYDAMLEKMGEGAN